MLYEVKFRHDSCPVGNHLIFDYEYLLVALLHEILLAGILFEELPVFEIFEEDAILLDNLHVARLLRFEMFDIQRCYDQRYDGSADKVESNTKYDNEAEPPCLPLYILPEVLKPPLHIVGLRDSHIFVALDGDIPSRVLLGILDKHRHNPLRYAPFGL